MFFWLLTLEFEHSKTRTDWLTSNTFFSIAFFQTIFRAKESGKLELLKHPTSVALLKVIINCVSVCVVIHLKVFTHKQREDEEGLFQLVNNPTKVSLHLFGNTEGFVVTEPFLFRLFFFYFFFWRKIKRYHHQSVTKKIWIYTEVNQVG